MENNMFKTENFTYKKENNMTKTEKETLKIMYKVNKWEYENAANHFMGLEHSYPTKEEAIKAYTFLKKDSPRCIFIILSDKGRTI